MTTELKASFKAIRASRIDFEGLELTRATAIISEMLARYGKSSFMSFSEVEAIVASCDEDGDNKLMKTEFLKCGAQVVSTVNVLVS